MNIWWKINIKKFFVYVFLIRILLKCCLIRFLIFLVSKFLEIINKLCNIYYYLFNVYYVIDILFIESEVFVLFWLIKIYLNINVDLFLIFFY